MLSIWLESNIQIQMLLLSCLSFVLQAKNWGPVSLEEELSSAYMQLRERG